MAIVFIILGAFLLTAAVRWNSGGKDVWTVVGNDFTSDVQGSFFAWAAAIIIIGLIGYVDELKPISNAMLVLIVAVLLLSRNGFFANLQKEITAKPATANPVAAGAGAIAGAGGLTSVR